MKIRSTCRRHLLKLVLMTAPFPAMMTGCGSNSSDAKPDTTPVVFTKYTTAYIPFTRYTTAYVPQVFTRYTTVYVRLQNNPPTAVAGQDQTVNVWDSVLLNGRNSNDPDQDFLGYTWAFISKPTGSNASFDHQNLSSPRFTPDVPGDYRIALTVTDGKATSAQSQTTVIALPYANTSNLMDPSGVVSVLSSSFEYSHQSQSETTVIIRMTVSTNDNLSHSFTVYYQAVDSAGNVIYSSSLNNAAPNIFQTSARINNSEYLKVIKWVITRVERHT